jgi:hypothetical protein
MKVTIRTASSVFKHVTIIQFNSIQFLFNNKNNNNNNNIIIIIIINQLNSCLFTCKLSSTEANYNNNNNNNNNNKNNNNNNYNEDLLDDV